MLANTNNATHAIVTLREITEDSVVSISMEINNSAILQSIGISELTAMARQSLRRETFEIRDWHVSQLGGGVGNPVSVGLYHFEGTGQDRNERIAWSVVLKIMQSPANVGWVNMGEGDDPTHWNYWKRELLVYQSGLLDTLPEGVAAPRCYGAIELPGNVAWLWLEDIVDRAEGAWPLDRYALAARHLGRLNGSYLSAGALPAFPWFSRGDPVDSTLSLPAHRAKQSPTTPFLACMLGTASRHDMTTWPP